jgi:histidyl-tRNA synthetase
MEKYKTAINEFNQKLIKNPMVEEASIFYGKEEIEIVKALQPRFYSRGNKNGDILAIWIDFTDTISGITIKDKMNFLS